MSPHYAYQISSRTGRRHNGWNRIAEYQQEVSGQSLRKTYLWGMDLSGSMQGAGGVGGLLAVTEHSGTVENPVRTPFYPTFDGNGNVSEYLDDGGAAVAHYEYDPFGNDITPAEVALSKNSDFSYRFSTKPLDIGTGLYYYGYRWYDPLTGRWPSRDPIGERYGLNLYEMCYNNMHAYVDRLGWEPVQPTPVKGGFGFSGWTDHDSGKSDDGNFKDRAGGRENTNVGSGLTGKDLFEHMKMLTKNNCCILDFRIAGHGWANSPNGRGDGIPSSHAGDEEGFNLDKTTGRPSTDGDVRDLKDLESEKAKGTIRFCLECTISIFACRISDGFIRELARISGCKVTAAAGACRKNLHGTGWESNADFPGDTNQFRQSDGGSEPTDAGHIFTPPPIP